MGHAPRERVPNVMIHSSSTQLLTKSFIRQAQALELKLVGGACESGGMGEEKEGLGEPGKEANKKSIVTLPSSLYDSGNKIVMFNTGESIFTLPFQQLLVDI